MEKIKSIKSGDLFVNQRYLIWQSDTESKYRSSKKKEITERHKIIAS